MDGQKLEYIRNLAVEYISSPSEERRKLIFAEMELTAASIPYEPSKLADIRQAYKLAREIMQDFTIDKATCTTTANRRFIMPLPTSLPWQWAGADV